MLNLKKIESAWVNLVIGMATQQAALCGSIAPTVYFLDDNGVQSSFSCDDDYVDSGRSTPINHVLRKMAEELNSTIAVTCLMTDNLRLSHEKVLTLFIQTHFFTTVLQYDVVGREKPKLIYKDFIVDSGGADCDFVHVLREPFSAN